MIAPGVTTRASETLLVERAADFLAAGPANAQTLVAHVCQLPGVPAPVAEHMAIALFAGHTRFARSADGMWRIRSSVELAPPRMAAGGALDRLTYAVVDVETTGTSPESGHRITEIAVVVVREGQVAEQFESLVNPERPIPPFITNLTNISWEMVKDAPRFRDVCPQVLEILEGHVFVAHNASFDWRFVSAEVKRATGRELDGRRLCTVRLARKLLPQLRRRSLDWVANHYNVQIGARHRAMGDTLATAHVLRGLLKDAGGRGCASWDDLEILLGARTITRRPRRPPAMPHSVTRDTTA